MILRTGVLRDCEGERKVFYMFAGQTSYYLFLESE